MLYNIPLYGYTAIHVSIHLLKDILIASVFATMNEVAMNICVRVLCEFLHIPLDNSQFLWVIAKEYDG